MELKITRLLPPSLLMGSVFTIASLLGVCEVSASDSNLKNKVYQSAVLGYVKPDKLNEISGMALSAKYDGCIWVNNDSGDEPNVYLINSDGELIATVSLKGVENRDWESLAVYGGYIYVGETGDNDARYPEKKIFRISEPEVDLTKRNVEIVADDVECMKFNFENGQRDCETLMFDPVTDNLVAVSKREDKIFVYEMPFESTGGKSEILVKSIAQISITQAVGGDISFDGAKIIVKNYRNIYFWERKSNDEPLSVVFKRKPKVMPYDVEPQGEAICWSLDGESYLTISEKHSDKLPIYIYSKK